MAHDLAGLVLHADDTIRMTDGRARRKIGAPGEQGIQFGLWPVQQEFQIGAMHKTVRHASNNGDRTTVAAHCVNGNNDTARAVRRPWHTLMGWIWRHGARGTDHTAQAAASSRSTSAACATISLPS